MRFISGIAVLAALLAGSACEGQTATVPASQPAFTPVTSMTVHAMAVSEPWMKYRLLPSPKDQETGNAAVFYLLARRHWPDQKTTDDVLWPENHRYDYLDTPIEQFPRAYAQRVLEAYKSTLTYAEQGAARRDVNWERIWDIDPPHPELIGQGRFDYLNDLRHVENLLSFRSRLEMLDGDWDAAHHTIQEMLSIARHVGREDLLIHKMVEMGFTEIALAVSVEAWIGRAGSPNLYWPLTNLPRPVVQTNLNGYYDDGAGRRFSPLITQALEGKVSDARWADVLREIVVRRQETRPPNKAEVPSVASEVIQLVKQEFEPARKWLRSRGFDDATIGSMSREHVVGLYLIREYAEAADSLWKAFGLPFPKAQVEMLRVWNQIAPQQPPASENPLIQSDLVSAPPNFRYPAVLSIRYNLERTDRYLALLRVIESLRDYAAKHGGMPPGKLEDVTDLVVPEDPMTGKAFGYEVKGKTVTLDATPPKPFSVFGGWRYELTFVK